MFSPTDPIQPQDPIYVVRVTQPVDPIRPAIINTWGINFARVIQQGNTVLNEQFTPTEPFSPQDPA
ncbi:hypothetical protein [Bacillus mycoides]|uniref:hypothetical protein n=1 Tax=Bacillus mycoides TaxID=1405 RepID=UPI001F3ED6AD|nr:hypothetical protein [Bacillus mycoides]